MSPPELLDLDPAIIDDSPVLQRWLEEIPDVLSDIETDPSFRPRIRLGYTQDWSDDGGGIIVGVEDIFLGRSGLTLSGDYQTRFEPSDYQYGADLRYHFLPLGHSVNIGPVLGYRHVSREDLSVDGVNVGVRLVLVPSRTGAADLSLTQTWVRPGSDRFSVSRFTLSAGYALTQTLRLSTDFRLETAEQEQTTDVGLLLEWML
ncbi:MAG: hypothetical protein F6K09_12195 [Merismopedia sp. SIO2A8]|nr:hypothetical protein [Merismopedia sp. SIO2A8]